MRLYSYEGKVGKWGDNCVLFIPMTREDAARFLAKNVPVYRRRFDNSMVELYHMEGVKGLSESYRSEEGS